MKILQHSRDTTKDILTGECQKCGCQIMCGREESTMQDGVPMFLCPGRNCVGMIRLEVAKDVERSES